MINVKKFKQFDHHDIEKNSKFYGQEEPPEVDLSLIISAEVLVKIFVSLKNKMFNFNKIK